MRYYETLYLTNPELSDEEYKEVLNKFNGVVEKDGGTLIKAQEWGKMSLAYQVKKFNHACYVLLRYCAEPGAVATLERELGLDERVLKYQTILLEKGVDPQEILAREQPPEKREPGGEEPEEETPAEEPTGEQIERDEHAAEQ